MLEPQNIIYSSPDALERVSEKYLNFIQDAEITSWINNGGELDIATEHQPVDVIERLIRMGHRYFSEKYLQEISSKSGLFNAYNIPVQYFGKIQSNKFKRILESCHTLESISTIEQADYCRQYLNSTQRVVRCYIQLNIGREPQKNGVHPENAPSLIEHCLAIGLPIQGLMCIPPKSAPPAPFFRQLRRLADEFHLTECQMGFSADHRIAIREGATSIRIASLLFNEID